METALLAIDKLKALSAACGIPADLVELGLPREAIDEMADAAMSVTRLLKNNVRDITLADARHIYRRAFDGEGER